MVSKTYTYRGIFTEITGSVLGFKNKGGIFLGKCSFEAGLDPLGSPPRDAQSLDGATQFSPGAVKAGAASKWFIN